MTQVSFYDSWVPPVKDGQYTVSVGQQVTSDDPAVPASPQASSSQTLVLRGPRFAVDPGDVQRAFPASGSSGVYDPYLPMLILGRRGLPWEREMNVTGPDPAGCPWVALLVFGADELLVPGGGSPPPPGSQQSPTRSAGMLLKDALDPPTGTLAPDLTLAQDEDPNAIQCNVIEVGTDLFEALVPGVQDLPLLAHVREVTTEEKVSSAAAHSWFSTVIANRFALAPAKDATTGRSNVAHLVSLEGFDTYLTEQGASIPGQYQRVRLISLYAWAFTALPDPVEDFPTLALNLISPASDGGSDLLMRIPAPGWVADAPPAPGPGLTALVRLQQGYTALSYSVQSGEQTFAWYRGPLAPVPAEEFMGNAPPGTPDNPEAPMSASEAMVYDSVTGLFDESYAVAFQTGRSLALASLPFATALLQYRRAAHGLVDQLLELMRTPVVASKLQADGILDANGQLTPAAGVDDLAALLEAGVTPNALVDVLATELANGIAQQIGLAGGFSAADAQAKPTDPATAPPAVPADLSALMQDPTVVNLLTQLSGLQTGAPGSGEFEASILPDQIVEWLAQTALLEGVPFSNLVPDERMLPVESVRFFYLDPNWIDALIDGALSAGIQSSRDSLLHRLLRDPLHDAVDAAIVEVRDKLRAVPPNENPPPPGSLAGFVLRSALVSGWPGLQVRAYSTADSAKPMKPLRLERVAPGVMIGIYPDVPVRLELNEPSEGLVFGVEPEGVALRYLPGTQGETGANLGTVIGGEEDPLWFTGIAACRRSGPLGTEGPLQIGGNGGLAAALQGALPGQAPALRSAALAVEMVRVPDQMLFTPVVGR
ncbi:MAG TPA: hypothetical protein VF712_00875 [Thermoleophilaceae bacterium]